jgi:hypothetical protein
LENIAAASILLTKEEQEAINLALELNPVSGAQYNEGGMKLVWG